MNSTCRFFAENVVACHAAVNPKPERTWILASALCLALPCFLFAADRKSASFEVRLPTDAELELNGVKMRTAGATRRFQSPPLDEGGQYVYTLKATWRGHSITRSVTLTAGRNLVVDLRSELNSENGNKSLQLRVPPAITLEAGRRTFLAIHLRNQESNVPVAITFSGLPRGVQIIAEGKTDEQHAWRGVVQASSDARPGSVTITARAHIGNARAEASFELVVTPSNGFSTESHSEYTSTFRAPAPGLPAAPENRPAHFIVRVPADAILEVNGVRTKSTGEVREFESPPLDPSFDHPCELKADWQGWTMTRQLQVRAGQEVRVDLAGGRGAQSQSELTRTQYPATPNAFSLPPVEQRSARLVVHLPPDAILEVDGVKVRSTGAVRRLESPPLEMGATYRCELKALWRSWTTSRQVVIRADQEVTVDLTEAKAETEPPAELRPAQFNAPPIRPVSNNKNGSDIDTGMLLIPSQEAAPFPVKVNQDQEVFGVLPAEQAASPPSSPPATSSPSRWFVMDSLQGTSWGAGLDGARMSIYGWTEASFTASSVKDNQLPMGFNYLANQFLLQQNWLRIERTVVTSGTTEPTFGFRSDWILPGSDYRFTISRGLFSNQLTANDGEPNTYGIDPVQFYGEAFIPTFAAGIDIKFGRMFCQYGAEAIDTVSNLLASHSYTFIYDPFTHTGLMSTIQLNPAWSIQLGIVMGPDVFINEAASPYSMFSAKWAPPGGRDSVLFSGLMGKGRFDEANQFNNPNILDLVYIHTFNPRFSYTLDALFGYQTNVPDIGTATWYSAVNYLTYRFTPRLSGTTRLEFFDDVDGNRTGFKGLYTVLTAGLNFQPRKEIIFRPEVRYDYNNESRPFQDNHGVFTAAADMIVRW
jgi:uncharacterized protein (TIGR03000 family)